MRILTLCLVVQAAVFYTISHGENVPPLRPLRDLPAELGAWRLLQEGTVEKEVLDVLKADDVLSRVYSKPPSARAASLYVAYFMSQRTGQTPHSPKNCLPGSGWVPSSSDVIQIRVEGEPEPIRVNRYTVTKGDEKSIVLYWYQTHNRVIASEYWARIYLVLDAIRYNRTDTALVRVLVPVPGDDEAAASATAVEFVQALFQPLRRHLPS